MSFVRAKSVLLASGVIFAVGAATLMNPAFFSQLRTKVRAEYEKTVLVFDTSAARAFSYGSQRLDSKKADYYDVELAETFLRYAMIRDSSYPYLHHQIARIEFLKGDFEQAMWHINKEIELYGEQHPNSYYIRGLIRGYMGEYEASITDYQQFLSVYTDNWAAINDYAWVLLKAGRIEEAESVTRRGLDLYPDHPWLLNTNAIALHELGYLAEARYKIKTAARVVSQVSQEEWLNAYPGNDPLTAQEGILALQEATRRNMHTIVRASIAAEKDKI